MVLKLDNVTVCAADSAYVELTAKALTKSMEDCRFADAILFSDSRAEGPFRCVEIPPLRSIQDYSDFCLSALPRHIETDFVLVIQWDGYVVDPSRWHPSFLKFDYVGAPWYGATEYRVGNGGFSLRSRRLLDAIKTLPLLPGYFEDQAICRVYRPHLESKFGIRFADEKTASRFSYEYDFTRSFGFHGFHNMWRYLAEDELAGVVEQAWTHTFQDWKSVRLVVDAWSHGRHSVALRIYRMLRQRYGYEYLSSDVCSSLPETAATLKELEKLLAA